MAKLNLTDITTSFASQNTLQANFEAIEAAIELTLSRDGTTPNQMEADLDMNSNNLLNIGTLSVGSLEVGGETLVAATRVPNWEGAWLTSTAYQLDDIVRESGSSYICVEAHTSGTFSTDLAANKWQLFASAGTSGAGSGDMLAANNLSDVDNSDTSLSNLGGGTVGIALFKDVTASAARTELGLAALAELATVDTAQIDDDAVTIAKIADAAIVTESEGISSNDNDTTLPTSAAVKDYVDNSAGGARYYEAFTASGTWTKPSGLDDDTMVTVELWGAGGGGGTATGRGGGGGGGYALLRIRAGDLSATESVTVAAATATQANGGNSTFGSHATAYGGAGADNPGNGGGGGGENAASTSRTGGLVGGGVGSTAMTSTTGGAAVTIFGGGGGGDGDGSAGGAGGDAVYGGAGGAGGNAARSGGTSTYGGNGGDTTVAGTAPGGGGGLLAGGARGEVRVWV